MGLVAWGETHIDSSVAGIAQSTVPIFTFLLAARYLPHERVGPLRIAGVALGFLGSPSSRDSTRRRDGGPSPGHSRSSSRRCRTRAAASTGSSRCTASPARCSRRDRCSRRRSSCCLSPSRTRRPRCRVRPRSRPARARPHPDRRGAAASLPRPPPAREPQALHRDVPHARLRRRVRCRAARRARDRPR